MNEIRVAILHYHLRGGGVSRIIEHTVGVLKNHPVIFCVISGEDPSEDLSIPDKDIVQVDGLSYGSDNPKLTPQELLDEVQSKVRTKLGGEPDIWHIHNHSLGKNVAYSQLALLLAENCPGLLLHIHDFAEDNRPDNYEYLSQYKYNVNNKPLVDQLYPKSSHIHYAVLTGRDFNFMKDLNLADSCLHLLSNPVDLDLSEQPHSKFSNSKIPRGKLLLYPSRVIPRKNIGEILLWSALAEEDEHFAVTLPPKNERYLPLYKDWKIFARDLNLPVTFEAGKTWDLSYPELIYRAEAFVTTSIAEGFGMVYLESWLAGKRLFGRILPDIVADFRDKGIEFHGMYDQLKIPVKWIGRDELFNKFEKTIQKNWQGYGLTPDQEKLENWINQILNDDYVDFGKLDEENQKQVIRKLVENPEMKKKMNPHELFDGPLKDPIINTNKEIIGNEFNLKQYGTRLISLYKKIQEASFSTPKPADSKMLLNRFLSPENFSLLRK